jgi:predicted TIM-barrel fold metal-dependent hydrolase
MWKQEVMDIHCHLFNVQYALKEVAAISWNALWGNYPHNKKKIREIEAGMKKRGAWETIEGIGELIAYVARLMKVALQSPEANYQTMLDAFRKSDLGMNKQLLVAPLMMDIYFAVDDNKSEVDHGQGKRGGDSGDEVNTEMFELDESDIPEFEKHFDELQNLILEEMGKDGAFDEIQKRSGAGSMASIFESVKDELVAPASGMKRKSKSDAYDGIEMSPGYRCHLEELEALEKKNKGSVFPFLAIDPRRYGIMKLIEMKVNRANGPFYGVKLYPPLGYLPTHPKLVPVFDYCEANDIPITVHCSRGGLKNFRKENQVLSTEAPAYIENFRNYDNDKSLFYANPDNWEPVLQKWNDVRLDLAHFGGGKQLANDDRVWMDKIIAFLRNQTYRNVYTDISYFSEPGLMEKITGIIQDENIGDYVCFGTDFLMIMLELHLGGLKNYFNKFIPFDQALHIDNAKRFLGI